MVSFAIGVRWRIKKGCRPKGAFSLLEFSSSFLTLAAWRSGNVVGLDQRD